jgi:murein DD-endopeptidase MepM/ murein hydrolase activator NlpD
MDRKNAASVRRAVQSARNVKSKIRNWGVSLALLVLPLAAVRAQDAPTFSSPLECEIGKTCVVQNYVDHGTVSGARDYRCGFLTYHGHKGTDIRVAGSAAIEQDVAVIAAAPGRVRAARDGMPDVSVRAAGKQAVAGREAGNSVVIDHGGGWETQYAHLRKGSVAVRAGDSVRRGQRLGLVGLSGYTEFHHLHFEVRHWRAIVDPFVGVEDSEPCALGRAPLWRKHELEALAYVATGLLDAGIAAAPPVLSEGAVDRERTGSFAPTAAAAVFWVQIYGAREDDLEEIRLSAPDGRVLASRRGRIPGNKAQWLAYVGNRRADAPWPPGAYRGEYALLRGPGEERVISLVREITLAP